MERLQLWGGIECTVNRVRDRWLDQLERNGHARRTEDLERIAGLGIRTLRYPLLWERTVRRAGEEPHWRWTDERMQRLRELGIRPIAGLVHHGSGPAHTNLLDEGFATGLAEYAGQVAARYPWIDAFTPVNEPLTTARFSGLYGLWYPHRHDDRSFVRALLVQCRATVLSMQAIRRVTPNAKLVQTDDLGFTHSTPQLKYQADFDNERRWLAWDLLCGRVDARHPLTPFLLESGASESELAWFTEHACRPDILGINHYLTSNRFLDQRLALYPQATWGSNGRERYADVDAVRVLDPGCDGWLPLLSDAAQRYSIPLAVTEVHLGCTREEQLRWLDEAWQSALQARARGLNVVAVTAWSLMGSHNWNTLLTRDGEHYEPGAFDTRSANPRATALCGLIRDLSGGRAGTHPILESPGWWRRPERVLYPRQGTAARQRKPAQKSQRTARPILITGGSGTLGRGFARICEARGLEHRLCTRAELDICNAAAVDAMLRELRPWCVVNAAGYVRVDDAEHEADRCHHENVAGPQLLARETRRRDLPFLTFSSDLVFDGRSESPYVESSPVAPLNEYGRSKREAELGVLSLHRSALVVRTSSFFGPWDERNFLTLTLRAIANGRSVKVPGDIIVSPTYVPDLVHACLDLLIDGESGIWHLTNADSVSWVEFARRGALMAGIDSSRIEPCVGQALGRPARRPSFSALTSERALMLGGLDDAIRRYTRESVALKHPDMQRNLG